ncbi:protoporphyrinogen oxidase HemJ [Aestuariivirga sp.]|uniref:protoporphyrinogen oxidase HemJ n=1 Tax=Aestuariivirga sp. TaxID=2650926 RepID=UPI0035934DE8
MTDPYSWIKILHILAVISWMAGLFYLPRLFVYHAERGQTAGLAETFKIMERRLLKAIMRPAALVTGVTGILLIWQGSWYGPVPVWLWLKLVLVIGMFLFHGLLERHVAAFRDDREGHSGRYFRVANEVPTLLLIFIVILVVAKPF